MITFSGILKDSNGQPRLGSSGITFTLYATQEGGEALWQESQTVQTDEQGRYTVLLGSTEKEGLPLEVFSSGKAQWLGVQVQGEEEQPRVLLVAVPYALKAANADTVGGKPLSSFVLYEDLVKEQDKASSRIITTEKAAAFMIERPVPGQKKNQRIQITRPLSAKGGGIGPFYGNEIGSNTYFGENTGASLTTGTNNSFYGQSAGTLNTTGSLNSFFGASAGFNNSTGLENTFLGEGAGFNNTTGSWNSFIGRGAGRNNTTGENNAFVGRNAGLNNTSGAGNAFFGQGAGSSNTTAGANTFFGEVAGFSNTTGADNSFFGQGAGYANITGFNNCFFGQAAGSSNTTAGNNSFFGTSAGNANTIGTYNSFFGAGAGMSNITGSNNSFAGTAAGLSNTAGGANAFFGDSAGYSNAIGNNNSFFGSAAGQANTTGNANSFFGNHAGYSNGAGDVNSFFGYNAGYSNIDGNHNAFFGNATGYANTTGSYNSFYGILAGRYNSTGASNTFLGYEAGNSNTTGNNNSFVGAYSDGVAGITNATAVGFRAQVTQSNSLVLGSINGINSATADTKVGIGTTAPVSHLNVRSNTNVSPRGVTNEQYNDGMDGVQFRGRKARGTSTTPAAVQSGDVLGNYVFDGHDGAAFGTGVQIRPVTEEAWTSTSHGAYLALWTTPPGTTINTEKVRITGDGNVGIGTTNPTERLHVVGNLKVSGGGIYGTLYGPASPDADVPDYVFDPDYKLMSLQELERFVSKERHLPDIPKASEIREKGVNVNEFQMMLLEKIEELTLYTVQQAKTIDQHKSALNHKDSDIAALKLQKDAEIAALNARLSALEQMMERLTKNENREQK